jgi:hypothetical protein
VAWRKGWGKGLQAAVNSVYALHESDHFLKSQTIRGGETEIVTFLAVRLGGVRTSQITIHAVMQKLLAFRTEPVLGVDHHPPVVDVQSLQPLVFLGAIGVEARGEIQEFLFGLLARRCGPLLNQPFQVLTFSVSSRFAIPLLCL